MGSEAKNVTLRRPGAFGIVLPLLMRHLMHEHASRQRMNGQRSARRVIGRLPEGWHVFRDVPVGERATSIDHVLVGPGGTFALSAKDLTGKVWVGARSIRHNGHPTNFLSKAACDATHVSEFLSSLVGRPIQVRGVLAILADEWTIDEEPADVHVGSPRGVRDWMLRLPLSLAPHEIVEIAAAARAPTTWSARAGTRQG